MLQAIALFLILTTSPLFAATLQTSAPSFSLKNFQQEKHSLSDYRGKVVLINFWASWCAPCQQELPELNWLATGYAPKDLRVLAINVDQDTNQARQALEKLGLRNNHMDVLLDPTSKVVSKYDINTMPTSVILDRKGKIRFIHEGFRPTDPSAWRKEIDQVK